MPESEDYSHEQYKEMLLFNTQQEFLELMVRLGVTRPAWNSAEHWNG